MLRDIYELSIHFHTEPLGVMRCAKYTIMSRGGQRLDGPHICNQTTNSPFAEEADMRHRCPAWDSGVTDKCASEL